MLKYIIRRLLLLIPTLLVISLVSFLLIAFAPYPPGLVDPDNPQALYDLERYNLHLPIFYARVGSYAEPDTLHHIRSQRQRQTLRRILSKNGNWPALDQYHHALNAFSRQVNQVVYDSSRYAGVDRYDFQNQLLETKVAIKHLRGTYESTEIDGQLVGIRALLAAKKILPGGKKIPHTHELTEAEGQLEKLKDLLEPKGVSLAEELDASLIAVEQAWQGVGAAPQRWKNYVPKFIWYGPQNQYHKWLSGILLRGDFGRSYITGEPVAKRFGDKVFWTFVLSFLSLTIALLISIPLGVLAAYKRDSWFDRISGVVVFALRALPVFWVATLLLMVFANPDVLRIFPSSFDTLLAEGRLGLVGKYFTLLCLPLVAYIYSLFATYSRTMRVGMLEVLGKDFIRTARAKGLSEKVVVGKHAFKNGLLPILTLFGAFLPAMIGGSVILETIFSIPGMGREALAAVYNLDTPMIMAIYTVTGFLTVLGYLLADILYVVVDPRIRLG